MATSEAKGKQGLSADSIVIRKCHELEEMRSCVALQKEVWNFSDAELVPLRMFVVAEKIGGQVIGAFESGNMVGFALAIPGTRGGHGYLHSHMVGVREKFRNSGLGRRIKWFQRDDALDRGFELMEWTFDPLEIKNAYLNIEKLGAIARRYNINQYGITSSPLQAGLPTDRLIAEWWLNSHRVSAAKNGAIFPAVSISQTIQVPSEVYSWKANPSTRDKAKAIQDNNRPLFIKAFADGLSVLNYDRDAEGNGTFLLARWNESFHYS
jgi:predicted GNAT superfamily acetyltransferase